MREVEKAEHERQSRSLVFLVANRIACGISVTLRCVTHSSGCRDHKKDKRQVKTEWAGGCWWVLVGAGLSLLLVTCPGSQDRGAVGEERYCGAPGSCCGVTSVGGSGTEQRTWACVSCRSCCGAQGGHCGFCQWVMTQKHHWGVGSSQPQQVRRSLLPACLKDWNRCGVVGRGCALA